MNDQELERACQEIQKHTHPATLQDQGSHVLSSGVARLSNPHLAIFHPERPLHLDGLPGKAEWLVSTEGSFSVVRIEECFLGSNIHYHVHVQ